MAVEQTAGDRQIGEMRTGNDFTSIIESAERLLDEVKMELTEAAQRVAIDLPRRSQEQSVNDGLHIFSAIYDLCGDADRAKAEALGWPGLPPEIYRRGPESYVEDWVFYNRPADWKPNSCR